MRNIFYLLIIIVITSCKQSTIQDELVILSPNEEISTENDSIYIEGRIVRGTDTTVNRLFLSYSQKKGNWGDEIIANDNHFKQKVYLKDTVNHFVIRLVGDYGNIKSEKMITVKRTLTAEFQKEIKERLDAEQKKKEEIIRKQKAQEEKYRIAWEKSKAGKIQRKYSWWSKEDCERVANKEIWIGMHYLMLVEERGYPDSRNISNYGRGDETQWCWRDYTTSCFYDKNGDWLIDSYN